MGNDQEVKDLRLECARLREMLRAAAESGGQRLTRCEFYPNEMKCCILMTTDREEDEEHIGEIIAKALLAALGSEGGLIVKRKVPEQKPEGGTDG